LNGLEASVPIDSNPVGATFAGITRGSGLTPIGGANSINSKDWPLTLQLNDYYQFAVTPSAGFEMSLNEIDFSERRSGLGVITVDLQYSLDNFTTSTEILTMPLAPDTLTYRFSIPLPSALDDLTSPVAFRFYGYGATNGNATWRLGVDNSMGDNKGNLPANLQVSGDLTAIPEPASLLLLGTGLVGAGTRRWRNRRKAA
jgi:hypothetical protein